MKSFFKILAASVFILCGASQVYAQRVTIETFTRAETDTYIRKQLSAFGIDVGELKHIRQPVTPANQTVIRQNQDTLYSGVVVDLSKPVRITLPEADNRYMSMHVISQDHFMYAKAKPGTYELTNKSVGTPFAIANFEHL